MAFPTVAIRLVAWSHQGLTDDCPPEADRSWADEPAVVGMAAAVAAAAAEGVDGTMAIPSCSTQIDSSTTDARGNVRPSTTRPKR